MRLPLLTIARAFGTLAVWCWATVLYTRQVGKGGARPVSVALFQSAVVPAMAELRRVREDDVRSLVRRLAIPASQKSSGLQRAQIPRSDFAGVVRCLRACRRYHQLRRTFWHETYRAGLLDKNGEGLDRWKARLAEGAAELDRVWLEAVGLFWFLNARLGVWQEPQIDISIQGTSRSRSIRGRFSPPTE